MPQIKVKEFMVVEREILITTDKQAAYKANSKITGAQLEVLKYSAEEVEVLNEFDVEYAEDWNNIILETN